MPQTKTPFRPTKPKAKKPVPPYTPTKAKKPVPPYKPKPVPSYTPTQQARRDVLGVVNPVIESIQREITQRTKAGAGAIGGYTEELARRLSESQGTLGGIYDQAQQRQAATDAALTGGLRSNTNTDADLLAQKLQALGPAAAAERAGEARQAGAGAAGALQGTGSASLSQLIAEGAAAQAYGAKLPDIARLGGLQSARDLQLASQRQLAEQTGAIRARVPEMVQGRLQQFSENRADREAAAFERAVAERAFGLDVSKFQQGAATDAARLDLDTYKAQTAAAQGDQRLALQQARYAADLGYKNRKLALDAAKLAKRNSTKKGITPTSYAKLKQQAAKDAERWYYGLDPAGKVDYERGEGVGRLDYQTALANVMRRHSLKLVDAQAILDGMFEPGEDGRPFLSFQQRQALIRAGVPEAQVTAAMWDPQRVDALLASLSSQQPRYGRR